MKHILWLNADKMGCGIYRCYIPALGLLETRVADSSWFDHANALLPVNGAIDVAQLEGIDLLVIQRPSSPIFLDWAAAARTRGIPYVIELDDDLFHLPRHNPAFTHYTKTHVRKALMKILREADAVWVSTAPLRYAVAEVIGRSDTIRVCMNHLHPSVWGADVLADTVPHDNLGTIVIGWQGSKTHDSDFRMALPALKTVLANRPQVRVRLFGDVPQTIRGQLPDAQFQWVKGVPFDIYPPMLKKVHFDIGIAPITNSRFNQAKSNIKVLEYGVLGLPVVASAVYPYAQTLRDGGTGFLAATDRAWTEALIALVDDAALRQRVGTALQQQVWQEWSSVTRLTTWQTAVEPLWPTQAVAS